MTIELRPPLVIEDKLSIDLMWLFVRDGRASFSDFVERFGEHTVAAFLDDLDAAGLQVERKR
jgi:hypothetical protein